MNINLNTTITEMDEPFFLDLDPENFSCEKKVEEYVIKPEKEIKKMKTLVMESKLSVNDIKDAIKEDYVLQHGDITIIIKNNCTHNCHTLDISIETKMRGIYDRKEEWDKIMRSVYIELPDLKIVTNKNNLTEIVKVNVYSVDDKNLKEKIKILYDKLKDDYIVNLFFKTNDEHLNLIENLISFKEFGEIINQSIFYRICVTEKEYDGFPSLFEDDVYNKHTYASLLDDASESIYRFYTKLLDDVPYSEKPTDETKLKKRRQMMIVLKLSPYLEENVVMIVCDFIGY